MKYTEGYSVHQGDSMSTQEEYHDECGAIMRTPEGTMSTLRGYYEKCGGYHEYTTGCSVHRGFHINSMVFSMNFPWRTEYPPVYRTHSGVLHRHHVG